MIQKKLQEIVESEEAAGRVVSKSVSNDSHKIRKKFQERMDIDNQDIIIQGTNAIRISRQHVSISEYT